MKRKHKLKVPFILIFILIVFTCKENAAQSTNDHLEYINNECPKIARGDFYWGKSCVKQKELLTCIKLINEIKTKEIPTFFYNKLWFNDLDFMRYAIDKSAIISIRSLGPEKIEIYKKKGKIFQKKGQYFFYTQAEGRNNKEILFPIKRIDCELSNSYTEQKGIFVKFTLSDGEEYQYGLSPKGDPLIGYKNSENLFRPEVLPNPEVWHKISLILSE